VQNYSSKLKNKNILVTGGVGFVGSHLVEELVKQKAKVIVVDINFDRKSYLFTENLDKKSEVIKLNICNYKKLSALIDKYKIEFIFHLAAQSLVDVAYNDPKGTLENNILSTINILEIARLNKKIKGVIVASSDKAYGKITPPCIKPTRFERGRGDRTKTRLKYIETDPLSGDHPYETSKSATDLISTTYYKTYKTPVVVTRFGNIYGEGDLNFSRIIPGIMKAIVKNEELQVRSDGKYIRDYLYVKDVVNGYLLLANNIDKMAPGTSRHLVKGQAFNFGSNETLSVLGLIKLVEKTLKKKIKYKILNTAKNEIPYQSLDYSKIKKSLGWKPRYSVSQTIKQIFQWDKKNNL